MRGCNLQIIYSKRLKKNYAGTYLRNKIRINADQEKEDQIEALFHEFAHFVEEKYNLKVPHKHIYKIGLAGKLWLRK